MKKVVDGQEIQFEFLTDSSRIDEIRELFLEYAQSLDIDLAFQNFEDELCSLPGKYSPPEGALVIATVNGQNAGCIALRKITGEICEMKRLYVRNSYRGLGIGEKLVRTIIDEARRLHYRSMRLDTLSTMASALKLYVSMGFYEIEPYIFNPIDGARYMELKLFEETA